MAQYIIVYTGGNEPANPEEGQLHFANYMEWIKSLGEKAVSPMNPIRNTCTMAPDGSVRDGSVMAMSGFTLIEAASMEEALAAASECPSCQLSYQCCSFQL